MTDRTNFFYVNKSVLLTDPLYTKLSIYEYRHIIFFLVFFNNIWSLRKSAGKRFLKIYFLVLFALWLFLIL